MRMISVISIALCMLACDSVSAQIIRVTVDRQQCVDGRYCRQYRDCGTGVVIASDGMTTYALTAAHVVRNATRAQIQGIASARVIASDECEDIALLEIAGRYDGKVSSLGNAAEIGSDIYLCGYGRGDLATFGGQVVSASTVTPTARDGDSGGPVYDASTRHLIGLVIGVDKHQQTVIVPAQTIQQFVSKHCPQAVARPVSTGDIPDREKVARIESLERRLEAAESRLLRIQQQASTAAKTIEGPPGPMGAPGRDGKPGSVGPAGPPGRDGKTGPLTITLNTLDDSGKVVGTTTKTYQPGEPVVLNFRPIANK